MIDTKSPSYCVSCRIRPPGGGLACHFYASAETVERLNLSDTKRPPFVWHDPVLTFQCAVPHEGRILVAREDNRVLKEENVRWPAAALLEATGPGKFALLTHDYSASAAKEAEDAGRSQGKAVRIYHLVEEVSELQMLRPPNDALMWTTPTLSLVGKLRVEPDCSYVYKGEEWLCAKFVHDRIVMNDVLPPRVALAIYPLPEGDPPADGWHFVAVRAVQFAEQMRVLWTADEASVPDQVVPEPLGNWLLTFGVAPQGRTTRCGVRVILA